MASAYSNIGNVYWQQGNLDKALHYQTKALKVKQEYLENGIQVGDTNAIATSLSNIGIIYHDMKNYSMALDYHLKALPLMQSIDNKEGEANSFNNIGSAYEAQKNFEQANSHYTEALGIYKILTNKSGIALSYYNLGNVFFQQQNFKKAEEYHLNGLSIVNEIGDLNGIKDANFGLSLVYEKTGNPKEALKCYKSFLAARDSLFSQENTKKTVQSEMNYEFEKKEAAVKLEQEKREAIAQAESKKQQTIIWSVCAILLLVFIFAIFVYRSFLQKQKINIEITNQKYMIEEKQKEILDSIHYAKRIQTALLPSERYVNKSLNKLEKKIN